METKMRITWALLPLGLLLHCTDANPTQPPSASSYIAPITTAGVTATPTPISTLKMTSIASNTATIMTAGVTATTTPTHNVTSIASNTATIMTAGVTATTTPTHKVTSIASNTATIMTAGVTATTTPTHKVTSIASNTATITTAGVTPGASIVTAEGTAGTGASGSSGTLTFTPDTTEVTQVSTTTSVGPTPWSVSSSPSHPPSTSSPVGSGSSPVGSGSSLATTTTSTQGSMMSTTTAETTTPPKSFTFVKSKINEENDEGEGLEALCRQLMSQMHDANCTLTVREYNGHITFDSVVMTGKVDNSVVQQYYEEITRKPRDNMTLIAILASCGALLAMIVGLAIYASYHRKSYRKNIQQHLTEELQTEGGYHDNPTLEVMEVQPEMQEKKVALNGEFNDSWIVPIDSLLKEDMPDVEDTHL
uniref:Podocalyxin n=1 Tax=Hucho hucho TaxID=62062 RepID=A0A4W5RFP5_9TELE